VTHDVSFGSALVVDDFEVMRGAVANLLRKQGFNPVDEVSSAPEALDRMADTGGYALVLSDWNMDPMTGLELLNVVRSKDQFEKTVFVLMTAEPTEEKRKAAEAAGVSGFLVKPFSAETLSQEIARVFGGQEAKT
jgi:two-component system chemotaxis response regulator CheY